MFFFFNDTATTEIYTLSLHDALPICVMPKGPRAHASATFGDGIGITAPSRNKEAAYLYCQRSEEHTSELQSRQYLVCRLLLEKKKKNNDDKVQRHLMTFSNQCVIIHT